MSRVHVGRELERARVDRGESLEDVSARTSINIERLRAIGCRGTQLARATAGTIRLKLLKVAAQVTVSVRRVHVQLSSAYPLQALFRLCHARLLQCSMPAG